MYCPQMPPFTNSTSISPQAERSQSPRIATPGYLSLGRVVTVRSPFVSENVAPSCPRTSRAVAVAASNSTTSPAMTAIATAANARHHNLFIIGFA